MRLPRRWIVALGITTSMACVDVVGPRAQHDASMPDLSTGDAGRDSEQPDLAQPDLTTADVAPPEDASVDADMDEVLRADAGADIVADVGTFFTLDGSGSTGAVSYQWDFGNGDGWDNPQSNPSANVSYPDAGRYVAVLTVYDGDGNRQVDTTNVLVTEPVVHRPSQSSTVVAFGDRVGVVSRDSNEIMMIEESPTGFDVYERYMTDRGPQTATTWDNNKWLVVACREDSTILYLRTNRTGEQRRIFLPLGVQPYGVVSHGDRIFATLQGTAEVIEIEDRAGVPTITRTVEVMDDPREIATLSDGRLLVSRWRSDDTGGEIAIISLDRQTVSNVKLAVAPNVSGGVMGGVPSYLGAAAVSPTAGYVVIPSLQANILGGTFRDGQPLTYDRMVRAITSFLDPTSLQELTDQRLQWPRRGFANAAVFSPRGDYLYVAMRGNQTVERLDMLDGGRPTGALTDVGVAVEGIAVSPDGRWLFADARLSRELAIYDLDNFESNSPVERITIPTSEPLDAELLLGKRLFNDAKDPRVSGGFVACAHCHLEGESDRRVWDFTDQGEGLRNTPALLGGAGVGNGPLHWSASSDEVQDVETQIRIAFGGMGLMSNVEYGFGTRSEPLGDPKAAVSGDLDALAAYVNSLDRHLPSPERTSTGQLSAEAVEGEALFVTLGCDTCHQPPQFTDSTFELPGVPLLHDVGTLSMASGSRLGGPLLGIDTPTLRGVWASPPYLHDGSAATLEDVLTTRNGGDLHGVTSSLDATQVASLVAYLRSLDYR